MALGKSPKVPPRPMGVVSADARMELRFWLGWRDCKRDWLRPEAARDVRGVRTGGGGSVGTFGWDKVVIAMPRGVFVRELGFVAAVPRLERRDELALLGRMGFPEVLFKFEVFKPIEVLDRELTRPNEWGKRVECGMVAARLGICGGSGLADVVVRRGFLA